MQHFVTLDFEYWYQTELRTLVAHLQCVRSTSSPTSGFRGVVAMRRSMWGQHLGIITGFLLVPMVLFFLRPLLAFLRSGVHVVHPQKWHGVYSSSLSLGHSWSRRLARRYFLCFFTVRNRVSIPPDPSRHVDWIIGPLPYMGSPCNIYMGFFSRPHLK